MKTTICFSLLCLFYTNGLYAQVITGKELMKLAQCKNVDCFNAIAVAKGFAFFRLNKDTLRSTYAEYLSEDTFAASGNPNVYSKNVLEVFFDNTGKNRFSMSFTTNVKKHYQSLLTEIQKLGFESSKIFDLKNERQVHYFHEKKRYQLVVSEYMQGKKANGKSMMFYRFSLLR